MKRDNKRVSSFGRVVLILIALVLIVSIFFSLKSLNSYVVYESGDTQANMISLWLFIAGVLGTIVYLKYVKSKK
jgi:formate hydrogenlyase subunit 3/multisubunit Na+/H+ antiporter MnhD subunit